MTRGAASIIRISSTEKKQQKEKQQSRLPAVTNLFRITLNCGRSEKPSCEFLNFHLTILETAIGLVKEYGPESQTDVASNQGFAPFQVCDLG